MSLIAKNKGGGFDPVPAGNHAAMCYSVVDLGTQENKTFGGMNHEVLITWEIPDLRIEIERDGKRLDLPRAISRRFTISLHERSNLRRALESWRGKPFTDAQLEGFDLRCLVGASCLLNVVHVGSGGKTYANVSTVTPLPKMMASAMPEKPENPMVYWEIEQLDGGGEIDARIPEWVRNKIKESDEYRAMSGFEPAANGGTEVGDDVPF